MYLILNVCEGQKAKTFPVGLMCILVSQTLLILLLPRAGAKSIS
jgi:hypothetical protein